MMIQKFKILRPDRNKYGKEMELNGYLAHDAVVLLIDAIERAGVADSVRLLRHLKLQMFKALQEE